jgi:hypothetical protein
VRSALLLPREPDSHSPRDSHAAFTAGLRAYGRGKLACRSTAVRFPGVMPSAYSPVRSQLPLRGSSGMKPACITSRPLGTGFPLRLTPLGRAPRRTTRYCVDRGAVKAAREFIPILQGVSEFGQQRPKHRLCGSEPIPTFQQERRTEADPKNCAAAHPHPHMSASRDLLQFHRGHEAVTARPRLRSDRANLEPSKSLRCSLQVIARSHASRYRRNTDFAFVAVRTSP